MQRNDTVPSPVPDRAKLAGAAHNPRRWDWVEASVWTQRLLAALGHGVPGGPWDSWRDKVTAPPTVEAAWKRGAANTGAAGVDRRSLARFKARAPHSLVELAQERRSGSYQPLPARRVQMPKGKGQPRP
jgi:RNA-directed DNA polymerase